MVNFCAHLKSMKNREKETGCNEKATDRLAPGTRRLGSSIIYRRWYTHFKAIQIF